MSEKFKIGPLCVAVNTSTQFRWTDEVSVFRVDHFPEDATPFVYSLEFVDEFEPVWGTILHHSNQMMIMDVNGHENRVHFLPGTQEPFALAQRMDEYHSTILIDRRAQNALKWDRTLLGLLSMEHDCLKHHAILLHASYIVYNGQAILFTAPSGNGKSTQADLWAAHAGAEIINGDRALIFYQDGQWYAGGFPVCGSSPHCLNRTAPLKAIVYLDKAPANLLRRLSGFQPVNYIYSQSFVNRWNSDDCRAISDMILALADGVPIFHYECTKEPDAVTHLRDAIFPH